MSNTEEQKNEIPFVKPARIGNFKVWRSKKSIGDGKNKVNVEQINISTLDESWQIKIPATFEMFSLIRDLFEEHTNSVADQRTAQLSSIFGNMLYASCIANGYFHRSINICATIYANPNLIKEDNENRESLIQDIKALASGFLAWREEYDKHADANKPTIEELESDQNAEEILNELAELEKKSE